MKVLITGNREKDLCKNTTELLEANGHTVETLSRTNDWDLGKWEVIPKVIEKAEDCDVFINMFANWRFNATLISYYMFKEWEKKKYNDRLILNIGSTTDRVKRAKTNLYHYEKLAFRDMSAGLAMAGVWAKDTPRVTLLSVGTMDNRAENNPGRKTLNMDKVANYILWILEQPKEIHINELSIDPMQK